MSEREKEKEFSFSFPFSRRKGYNIAQPSLKKRKKTVLEVTVLLLGEIYVLGEKQKAN